MGSDDTGQPIFSVLVKRTYDLLPGKMLVPTAGQLPLREVDEYWEPDPERSTVRYESELAAFKTCTDVVVVGKAYAPYGKPAATFEAAIEVGNCRKAIRVFGNRQCVYRTAAVPQFTDPVPVSEVELRYEKAYGGSDRLGSDGEVFAYPRNRLGTGFAIENRHEKVHGLPLPQLEDPDDLLTPDRVIVGEPCNWHQQPLPANLGWFGRTDYPRCSFVGSIPSFISVHTALREEKLGLVPASQIALARQFRLPSFDARFNSGASLGLSLPFLSGDERIGLKNVSPEGSIEFRLAGDRPRLMLDIGLGENELEALIHTVQVRVENSQVDVIWRGAHHFPGFDWLTQLKRLRAKVT
jgi:hypothetical protein